MKKLSFTLLILLLFLACFSIVFAYGSTQTPTTTVTDSSDSSDSPFISTTGDAFLTTAFPSTPLPSDVTLPTHRAEFIRIHREVDNGVPTPSFGIFRGFAEFELFRDLYFTQYYRETPFRQEYNLQLFYNNHLAFVFLRLPSSSIPRLDSLVWSPEPDYLHFDIATYTPPNGATDEQEWLLLVPVDKNTVSPSNLSISIQFLSVESSSEIGYAPPTATPVTYDTAKSSAHHFIPTPNFETSTGVFPCQDVERLSEYRRTFLRAMDESDTVDLSIYDEAFFSEYALIIAYIDHIGSDETELGIRRVDAVGNHINLVLSRHAERFPDYPYADNGAPGCVFVAIPRTALPENPHIEIQLLFYETK